MGNWRRRRRRSLVPLLLVLCCSVLAKDIAASMTTTTLASSPVERDPREYCAAEEFKPKCLSNEVVLITEAQYGRMEVGECVKTNYGYIGCGVDVIGILDDECSGKRSCSIRIPDTRLEDAVTTNNICPKEFKAYLNVSYECIPVQELACGSCSMAKTPRIAKVSHPKGFLGSIVTLESKSGICGSSQCPWVIEVESGQTINLTLYDFSSRQLSSGAYPGQCIRLAVIKEEAHFKESPICYRYSRIQTIYSSVSHSVQIHVVSHEVLRTKGRFLIEYEAVGCPDLQAPENAWLQRHDDRVVVGCNDASSQGVRWESRCVDTKWQGEIGTCPGVLVQTTNAPGILTLPLGVLVAIVLGIALVIGVLIVTVGVICLKRQQNEMLARAGHVLYVPAGQCYELREDYAAGGGGGGGGHTSTSVRKTTTAPEHAMSSKEHHLLAAAGRRNVYAHTRMDSRPLPSLPNLSEASSVASSGACRVGSPCGGCPGSSTDQCPYHPRMTATLGRTSHASAAKTGGASAGAATGSGKRKADGGFGSPARVPCPTFVAAAPCSSQQHPPPVPCASPLSAAAIPQHYTVLDPIEVQQQQLLGTMPAPTQPPTPSPLVLQSAAAVVTDGAPPGPVASTSSGPPKPPLPLAASGSGSGHGSRPPGNEGIEKSQCREITLRPTRQNSARSKGNDNDSSSNGNSSWP